LPTLIFVHGACVRDAPWWWSQMTEPLAGRGIASVAVPLPSCGETGDGLGDLYADVDEARQAIAEAEAPVVLCGHSYRGMVITQAGADQRVAQLLYYFVCTEDLAIPTELQRQRASPRARLIDFPSGHHPFLSQPEALVQSIAAEIDSIA
jgi:pimeloyl-ACP methyl ester carboxylesterase